MAGRSRRKSHGNRRAVHGILLLDKPQGGSSNHALQRAKRLFNAQKAGHTGSLDPLATGMLPVCFGEATKLSAFLLDADKAYETTMQLGVRTDSADADGKIISTTPVPEDLDEVRFRAIVESFRGAQKQIPPMVSAIKVDGTPLYKLAREGVEIERKPRDVIIHELEVLSFDGCAARLRVRCSKGTYIRSLVSDIGDQIGCGAHLNVLRRTAVSPFDGADMHDFAELETAAGGAVGQQAVVLTEANVQSLDRFLLPIDAGLGHLPKIVIGPNGVSAFRHGQGVAVEPQDIAQLLSTGQVKSKDVSSQSGDLLCRAYEVVHGDSDMPTDTRLVGLANFAENGHFLTPKRVIQWS